MKSVSSSELPLFWLFSQQIGQGSLCAKSSCRSSRTPETRPRSELRGARDHVASPPLRRSRSRYSRCAASESVTCSARPLRPGSAELDPERAGGRACHLRVQDERWPPVNVPGAPAPRSSSRRARTATPAPVRQIRGARMNTISSGPPGTVVSSVRIADSFCRPYALRSTEISSAPNDSCGGCVTSLASRMQPAQVPNVGRRRMKICNAFEEAAALQVLEKGCHGLPTRR